MTRILPVLCTPDSSVLLTDSFKNKNFQNFQNLRKIVKNKKLCIILSIAELL